MALRTFLLRLVARIRAARAAASGRRFERLAARQYARLPPHHLADIGILPEGTPAPSRLGPWRGGAA